MTRTACVMLLLAFAGVGLGCETSDLQPAKADTTYGAPVDASKAIPARAVLEQGAPLAGRRLALDGRITGIGANGCTLRLDAGGAPPLIVGAVRTADGSCAWQVPADVEGFAVAAGTLRIADDTLRLTANGVRVTPVRVSSPDS